MTVIHRNKSLIIGVGLPKTGTTSLNGALEILGYRSIHNPMGFRMHIWHNGNYHWKKLNRIDAITNCCEHFYPMMDYHYPTSKFILTIRNKEQWLNSCENKYKISNEKMKNVRIEIFGTEVYSREIFESVYEFHKKRVLDYFKDRPDKLLVLDVEKDTQWKDLCNFLKKPIPDSPFPHLNKTSVCIKNE